MSNYPMNQFNHQPFINSSVQNHSASPQLSQSTVFPFHHSFLSFPPPRVPVAQHVVSNGPTPGNNFRPPPVSPFLTNAQQFTNSNSVEQRTDYFVRNGVGTPPHFDVSFRSSSLPPHSVNHCNVQQGINYGVQNNLDFRASKDSVSDINMQYGMSQNFNFANKTGKFPSDFKSQHMNNREWTSMSHSNHHLNNFNNDNNYIRNSSDRNKMHQNNSQCNTWKFNSNNDFSNNQANRTQMNWKVAKFGNGKKNKMTFHNRGNSRKTFHNNKQRGKQHDIQVKCESKPYVCDTCDRAFNSEAEYQSHMSSHVKCRFPNCQFEAHPAIVALHKKMQHDTGYADQINKLKNDEEIEKWRAERIRNFPTAANILKRKAEEAEKEARGEVIEEKEFGKFKKQKQDQTGFRKKREGARRGKKRSQFRTRSDKSFISSSVPSVYTVSDTDSDDDSHIKLHRFLGIFASMKNDIPEDMPRMEKIVEISTDAVKKVNCNEVVHEVSAADETALQDKAEEKGAKIQNVDLQIENDLDNEAPLETPIIKDEKFMNINIQNAVEDAASLPNHNSDKDTKSSKRFPKQDRNKAVNNRYKDADLNSFRKETLLEKLLADQIRKERNIIMQCVRHVVKNDFFGIGKIH